MLPQSRHETDAFARRGDNQRRLLEIELEAVGLRLNRARPDVVLKPKVRRFSASQKRCSDPTARAQTAGGITINNTVPLTKIDERNIRGVLGAYKVCFGRLSFVACRADRLAPQRCTTWTS